MGGDCGREGGGQDGVEWGGKWDNCNSIMNKYIKKKKKKNPCPPEHWASMRHKAATILEPTGICPPKLKTLPSAQHWGFDDEKQEKHKQG